ncbi:Maleate isomerase [Pigmentiphaga humi]|uniref:Maleate isomerase n=1 Tax=Pigmentiphaga humi TaxID=2478468 RepID=A0A3P4B8B9_9BURK|nr:aspartate/glutamate racemase family protein [Pigmentiphaga humi]VCU71938.1 Maleate isomerase [Pigmentiphaga humi]
MESAARARPLKVGLIVPINNTTMERELAGWLPPGSTVETRRIPRGKGLITPDVLPAYVANTLELARTLPDDIDAVAYGCTAAGFVAGPEGEAQLAQSLRELTGKPVITTARAMVVALSEAGAQDIALVTPYSEQVNRALMRFLDEGRIAVRRLSSFEAADVEALGRITHEEVAQRAREVMDEQCGAMFIACSQLPTQAILDDLEREFGKPVLSSIKATAMQTARAVLG